MYLMYVDESGDPGLVGSPTRYYALTGVVMHELAWRPVLERMIGFRRRMKVKFGLAIREEIHAARMITSPGHLAVIRKQDRLTILRHFADEMGAIPELNIISVLVDKQGKPADYKVFEMAWRALLQRFENTMAYRNFRGPANADERGMVFPDPSDVKALTQLTRKMRHYNPVPNQTTHGPGYRNLPMLRIIEDPSFRDSKESYSIQMADLAAFLLYQFITPNTYMKTKGGQHYFKRLDAILCKAAAPRDPAGLGIVRL